MWTTPEEAAVLTKDELYARLIETETDRNNLRDYVRNFTGQSAMERQERIVDAIVDAIRSEGAVAS